MLHRGTLLSCLLLLGLSTSSTRAEETPQKIFLLIGQSNMAGRAPLEKGDELLIPGVFLFNDKGAWEAATNPLNRFSNIRKELNIQRVGPGYGFALKMREADPNTTIGLFVNARGGSKIDEWGKDAPLYMNTLKRIKASKIEKFAGVLWHQGESNANDKEYFTKLTSLIERLRTDLGDPNLPFVAGEIAAKSHVNQVFAEMPGKIKNTATASAEGLKLQDSVHFDRKSQLLLGQRYTEAYLNLIKEKK